MAVIRRKRRRTLSLDAEIGAKARQIHADQMAEAMTAATLMIVARKLDEIRTLLSSLGGVNVAQISQGYQARPVQQLSNAAPPIEHPCVHCGREGVRRTRPSRFNRQGSWYCLAHAKLGAVAEYEDKVDASVNLGPPLADKQPQLQAVPQRPTEPAGAGSLAEAMASAELDADAALGVPQ